MKWPATSLVRARCQCHPPVILAGYNGVVKSNVSSLFNTSHVFRRSPFSLYSRHLLVNQLCSHKRRRKTVIHRLSLSRLGGVYFIDDGPAGHGNIFRTFVSAWYIGKSLSLARFLSLPRSFFLYDSSHASFRLARIAITFVEWVGKYWNFEWRMPVLGSKINS